MKRLNYTESQLEYLKLRIDTLEKEINNLEKENKYLKYIIYDYEVLLRDSKIDY
jgi:chaperonin cofactor prefoldin